MSKLYKPDLSSPVASGIMVVDEMNAYNGGLHNYDWSIEGKKEMLIPYNNDQLSDAIEQGTAFTRHHITPEETRFEVHRVWVVNALLKKHESHIYKRRVFYIDEDAWSIVMADAYDKKDNHIHTMFRYGSYSDVANTFTASIDAFHDLEGDRYYTQQINLDTAILDNNFSAKKDFNPKNLSKMYIFRQ